MDNLTVDHLDHNKRNNEVSNLEWVSKEENLQRAKEDYKHDAFQTIPSAAFTLKVRHISSDTPNKVTFSNYTECAQWIQQKMGMKNVALDHTIAKLKKAVTHHTTYCNYYILAS